MIRIFISYAHADEALRQEFDKHLASLKHQGLVEVWHDRRIAAGEEWANAIDANLRSADVILLLVSADFIASRYCYEVELQEALRRHTAGEAVVIGMLSALRHSSTSRPSSRTRFPNSRNAMLTSRPSFGGGTPIALKRPSTRTESKPLDAGSG